MKKFEDSSVAEASTEEIEINDEFCPNEEYLIDDLNDENSVTFRFVVYDSVLSNSLDSFKSKVIFDFETSQVEANHRIFKITGYEHLENESKFYMKVMNMPDVVAAVRTLKSDHIHMRKMPIKRTNP